MKDKTLRMLDLEKHICITAADAINNIVRPLGESIGIKFFRYLKLYRNGKRVLLSNIPDAIRYMYSQGNYINLWYDGEFPDFLKPGWHCWKINRLLDTREVEEKIENDLISLLGVNHGMTYIFETGQYYEIYSFDTVDKTIYQEDKQLLLHFIYYFKEQAKKLIEIAENESIHIPIINKSSHEIKIAKIVEFFKKTKIHRYYLSNIPGNPYITSKEAECARWLVEGKSAKEIARLESVQVKTVERHIENMRLKLNCQKQTQLLKLFLDAKFLETFI